MYPSGKPVVLGVFEPHWSNLDDALTHVTEEHNALASDVFWPLAERLDWRGLMAADLDDLWRAFRDFGDRIVAFHFAGHANGLQLFFESAAGDRQPTHGEGLAEFLGHQEHLQFVFLNGCGTAGHVQRLHNAGVPVVVATRKEIPDAPARSFAKAFYERLAEGNRSLQEAFDFAAARVNAEHAELLDSRKSKLRELYVDTDLSERFGRGGRFWWDIKAKPDLQGKALELTLDDVLQAVGITTMQVAKHSQSYRKHARQYWESRGPELFLESQTMQLLVLKKDQDPHQALNAIALARQHAHVPPVGRDGATANPAAEPFWQPITRDEVVAGQIQVDHGSPISLRRMVLTTDAGIGKTANLWWLHQQLSTPGADSVVFLVRLGSVENASDFLVGVLLGEFRRADQNHSEELDDDDALGILRRLRDWGRIVLLIDDLDQATTSAIRMIQRLLEDNKWNRCRIILSGRPHALHQHWKALLDDRRHGWRFVQVNEFTPDEQRIYLGRDRDGRDRLERIPQEAQEILGNPRVLFYLRSMQDEKLELLRTTSDIYWQALWHMVQKGLQNSEDARLLGAMDRSLKTVNRYQIELALDLLAGLAFFMLSTPPPTDAGQTSPEQPNFNRVAGTQRGSLHERVYSPLSGVFYDRTGRAAFERDMECLAAMNEVLQHGFVDTPFEEELLWRNRSLQEFLAGLWLSRRCSSEDAERMGNWLYLPHDPRTEEYYWLWRFTVEMPLDARKPENWIRAVSPLYCPGDGTIANTRRSTEMIYYSWHSLQHYAETGYGDAKRLLGDFQGEFLQILQDSTQPKLQQTARAFVASLRPINGGLFEAGSPRSKSEMPRVMENHWRRIFDRARSNHDAVMKEIEESLRRWPFPAGPSGEAERASQTKWFENVILAQDLEAIKNRFWNQRQLESCEIEDFEMSRFPVLNSCYRLFDPGHGLVESYYLSEYRRVSGSPEQPVIFVSWHDAWVFCRWVCWQDRTCRLPYEEEWEYACRTDCPRDWDYWWGLDFDASRITTGQNADTGATTAPRKFCKSHANRWGLVDMLGNVWEWCANEFILDSVAHQSNIRLRRVMRGGGWGVDAWNCLVTRSLGSSPSSRSGHLGFRVAATIERPSGARQTEGPRSESG
jgi:formylglycine-generating enzyme required for sulfatase activity